MHFSTSAAATRDCLCMHELMLNRAFCYGFMYAMLPPLRMPSALLLPVRAVKAGKQESRNLRHVNKIIRGTEGLVVDGELTIFIFNAGEELEKVRELLNLSDV